VKITQYGHGVCSLDGQPCGCKPKEHSFVLAEEKDPYSYADTFRFLRAGAKRSLWLRVRKGQLPEAYPFLQGALRREAFVMTESNSILGYLKPSLYLAVLDRSQRDFKSSARHFIGRSDALVPVDSRLDPRAWPALDCRQLENKPVFPVSPPGFFNPQLCRFVCQRLPLPMSEVPSTCGG
jgi:hypothetical protein